MSGGKLNAVVTLALRYLGERRLATWVSIWAVSLSVLLVSAVGNINFAIKKTAVEGSIRYPLLVGPDGASSTQLLLSTIFHIDKPTGTIPFSTYEDLIEDRRVITAYPMALADSVGADPIVGTNERFLADLLQTGEPVVDFSVPENAILGAEAARRTGLRVGDTFHGTHGMVSSHDAHAHEEIAYRVRGILPAVNGPEDAAVYTSYQAVWKVHAEGHGHREAKHNGEEHGDKYNLGEGRLTAVLVKTSNPAFTAALERELSLKPGVQAVDTGRAIRRMVSYMNKGERLVEVFGMITTLVAAAMILVTLIMSLNERRKELALLRCLGVGRGTLASVVAVEALVITLGGALLGLVLGHLVVWWSENLIREAAGITVEPWTVTSMEIWAAAAAVIAGQILALSTLVWTYRLKLIEETSR